MIRWVQTVPQPEIDHSQYRPFIRNDWFRNHYMFFAYWLMAVLAVLLFVTGGMKGVSWFLRIPVFVLVFLAHELLHILVIYRIGDIYLSHSGLFFWMNTNAEMSKGRFWLFIDPAPSYADPCSGSPPSAEHRRLPALSPVYCLE